MRIHEMRLSAHVRCLDSECESGDDEGTNKQTIDDHVR